MTQEETQELIDVFTKGSIAERKQFFSSYVEAGREMDVDERGNNILHYAARYGTLEDFDTLMELSVEDLLEVQNSEGMTPDLYNIAYGRDVLIAKKVTEVQDEKSMEDALGNAPLHLAAAYNPDKEFTEMMLKLGYWIHHTNKAGETPLDLAVKHQSNPEVIQLILDAEAQQVARYGSCNKSPEARKQLESLGYELTEVPEESLNELFPGDRLGFSYTRNPLHTDGGFIDVPECVVISVYNFTELTKITTTEGTLLVFHDDMNGDSFVFVTHDGVSHFVKHVKITG